MFSHVNPMLRKNMGLTWGRHGVDMGLTWGRHAGTHEEKMGLTWDRHGLDMGSTCNVRCLACRPHVPLHVDPMSIPCVFEGFWDMGWHGVDMGLIWGRHAVDMQALFSWGPIFPLKLLYTRILVTPCRLHVDACHFDRIYSNIHPTCRPHVKSIFFKI